MIIADNNFIELNVLLCKTSRRTEVFQMRGLKRVQIANVPQNEGENDGSSNGTSNNVELFRQKLENTAKEQRESDRGMINDSFNTTEEENGSGVTGTENTGGKKPNEDPQKTGEDLTKIKSEINLRNSSMFLWSRFEWVFYTCCSCCESVNGKVTLCLDRPRLVHWMTLSLVALTIGSIIYFIAGPAFLPGSQLFSLVVLFVLAYVLGALVKLIKIPSLLGMLFAGLLLRNIGFIHLEGVFTEVTATLREVALCIILIRAGLGLDPKALKSLKLVILRLALIPGIVEGFITTIITHFLLGLPWMWGVLLGAILAAVSPAVVIPCLFSLQERGYGTGQGIPTLIVAAASLDDILAITVFGVVLNVIYSTGKSLTMQIIQGPLGIIFGVAFGVIWGFIAHFVPHQKDNQVVLFRVLMIAGGGLMAIIGSGALGYQGAGPLGCIIAAFVACLGWKKQGYDSGHNPVADVFQVIWAVFQPILFGLIGSEVDVSVLDISVVGNGFIALLCSLLCRVVVTVLIAYGVNFNWKEKTFIAWAWFPKATVQAALGPLALDLARRNGSEEEVIYATKILVLAVLAILFTAPIGAVLIRFLGPKLLTKAEEKTSRGDDVGLQSREEDKNQI